MSMSLNIANTAKMPSENYCVDEALDDIKMRDELIKLIRYISRRVSFLFNGLVK